MKALYIFGLIVNTIAAMLTGVASVIFFMNGNIEKGLLELVLFFANTCFFISNSINLKNKISSKRY